MNTPFAGMVKVHYRWYFCLVIKSTVNLDRNLTAEPEKSGKQNVEQEMKWETIQILYDECDFLFIWVKVSLTLTRPRDCWTG